MEVRVELDSGGFPQEEYADVKQCLETLLSIRAGSQPLDRELGIDISGIAGYPLNVAKNMLTLEIIEKVGIYEPRAEVVSVDFDESTDGQLKSHIHFIKAEG